MSIHSPRTTNFFMVRRKLLITNVFYLIQNTARTTAKFARMK